MKFLYIRNHASVVNVNNYNLQEIGFSRALADLGHDCDIIYYTNTKGNKIEEIYDNGYNKVRILWMKGIKIKDNAVYPKLLNKKIFKQYEYIITTEYTQLMTYLLTFYAKNKLILYQGPYQNQNNKYLHYIYDHLFLCRIRNNIKNIFVKSSLAGNYLEKDKKMKDIHVLGVGLNNSNFEYRSNKDIDQKTLLYNQIMKKINNKKVLLYIGILEERRNIKFIFDILYYLLKNDSNYILILVGKGKEEDVKHYFEYAKELNVFNNIIHIPQVDQNEIKHIYTIADAFLLPTRYEIFGMVLLESMYFGTPVITSLNGGSDTLIKDNDCGIIVEDFNVEKWGNEIENLMNNKDYYKRLSENSKQKIKSHFLWSEIAKSFLISLEKQSKKRV